MVGLLVVLVEVEVEVGVGDIVGCVLLDLDHVGAF